MRIECAHPDDPDARQLIDELGQSLRATTGRFFPESYTAADLADPRSSFLVARADDDAPLGCGALRPFSKRIAEVKRMYARPGTKGVGAAILQRLEDLAREFGYDEIYLETGVENVRAIAFYERNGYRRIPNFGHYAGRDNAACFGKRLRTG